MTLLRHLPVATVLVNCTHDLKIFAAVQADTDYNTLQGKLDDIYIRLVGQMAAGHFVQEMQRFMCWKAYKSYSTYTTKR